MHWQAGDRQLPAPQVTVAGESALWVDPAEIPAGSDIGKLGRALAAGRHGERDELMASTAAYSGLRWGELTALTIAQVDQADRVITVDRKVVEVAGHLYVEAPKCRKYRRTIYPRRTPDGYPLAERLAARIEEARAGQEAGTNPLGLIFPSPKGKHWRSSNFNRNVLKRAYLAIGWRDAEGNGRWTWHSLRHVFCDGANMRNDSGPVLVADSLQVGLGMLLRRGFTAIGAGERGAVRLTGAHIGGSLECDGASLRNDSGPALSGDALQVGLAIFLRRGFTATGARRARCGPLAQCPHRRQPRLHRGERAQWLRPGP